MRRIWLLLACAVGLAGVAAVVAVMMPEAAPAFVKTPPEGPDPYPVSAWRMGAWQPATGLQQIPLWPDGAPDMAGVPRPGEKVEIAKTPNAIGRATSEAAWNVSVPTMTVYPPRGTNTGAAVVVFPGGGFKAVVLTLQGTEICDWITSKGMTCVLLKYRVPGTNHHYDPACDCAVTPDVPRALQDAQRTIKLVRSRAADLNVEPDRIGVMGFSAGGYLVAQTSTIVAPAYAPVDAADRLSSRPDFAIAFYPGHLCRDGGTLDPTIRVTRETPPTFLLQAWDDPVDEICNSTLYARALDAAGVPAEVHLFARGGHAFGRRRTGNPVDVWPTLVEHWLGEIDVLQP